MSTIAINYAITKYINNNNNNDQEKEDDKKNVNNIGILIVKVAKNELREDGNTRTECLKQFKEWIKKNPDIKHCIIGMYR